MRKILPYEQWSEKDKKLNSELKDLKLTPEEAYEIS